MVLYELVVLAQEVIYFMQKIHCETNLLSRQHTVVLNQCRSL